MSSYDKCSRNIRGNDGNIVDKYQYVSVFLNIDTKALEKP